MSTKVNPKRKKTMKNVSVGLGIKEPTCSNKVKSNQIKSKKDEECFYCNEPSSQSIDGWIQCSSCLRWVHDACAGVEDEDDNFVCEFCE